MTPLLSSSPPISYDQCRHINDDDIMPCQNQIAGHTKEKGHKSFLISPSRGLLYKPILTKPSLKERRYFTFDKEIEFYEKKLPLVPELRPWVPAYHGVEYILDDCTSVPTKYIVLEDLTRNFVRPSIIDIKIGRQTYVDGASEEKVRYEISKNPYQSILGFRISGIKVYRPQIGQYCSFDRKWASGKAPGLEMRLALEEFFFDGQGYAQLVSDCVPQFLELFSGLLAVFQNQHQLRFIASSLLLMYESDEEAIRNNGGKRRTLLKFIDFAHAHRLQKGPVTPNCPDSPLTLSSAASSSSSEGSSGYAATAAADATPVASASASIDPTLRDEGVIYGLERLIEYFSEILHERTGCAAAQQAPVRRQGSQTQSLASSVAASVTAAVTQASVSPVSAAAAATSVLSQRRLQDDVAVGGV